MPLPVQDGFRGHDDYPAETPVLTPKASAGPLDLPAESMANMDRVYWVTELRPMLIAAGNLVETQEMQKEFKKLSKGEKPREKQVGPAAPLSAAVRTPAGDWVPPDRKSAAAGEKDDEPDTPF